MTDAIRVKPLVWDADSRVLSMDSTMHMSKAYNWDAYECFRREAHGLGGGYIIWPDGFGSPHWNLYGTFDGLYVQGLAGEEATKAAAQADYADRIRSALEPVSVQEAALSWASFDQLMQAALALPEATQGKRRVLQEIAALRALAAEKKE